MRKSLWFFSICSLLFIAKSIFWKEKSSRVSERVVNVYNWAEFMSPAILEKFSKETGIKVHYDVFDTNDVLEAKLLTGKTGYDVVFPSASPYFQRLKQAKIFKKIDKSRIKNLHLINPKILKKLQSIDKDNEYGVPYLWGTAGFAYNLKKIEQFIEAPLLNSWKTFLDPQILSKLSICGISLMDSPVELFPAVLKSQNKNPNSSNPEDLKDLITKLLSIRPYIRKFTSTIVNELSSGDLCLVHTWSADARLAQERSKGNPEIDIRYVIPEDGTSLWMDIMAIPEDSPNPDEALIFIDFILRPENIAEITNTVYCANPIPSSNKFIKPHILKDTTVYPPDHVLDKAYTDDLFSATFERLRNRAMIKIKTGK